MNKIIKTGKIKITETLKDVINQGEWKNGKYIVNIFAGSKKYTLKNSVELNTGMFVGVEYENVIEIVAYSDDRGIPEYWEKIIIKKHHKRYRIYLIEDDKIDVSNSETLYLSELLTMYKTTLRGIAPRSYIRGYIPGKEYARIPLGNFCRGGRYGNITYISLSDSIDYAEKTDDTHKGVEFVLSIQKEDIC
jgi:hypothetical protein